MKRFVLPIAVGLLILFGLSTVAFSLREDAVVVARFLSPELERGAPPGWILDRKAGTPVIRFERDGDAYALNLVSDRHSAFGISRPLRVNVRYLPELALEGGPPAEGRRHPQGRNQRPGSQRRLRPSVSRRGQRPVVGYIWDNEAPGPVRQSPYRLLGKVRYIVLGTDRRARPVAHGKRNVYEDYKRLFRKSRAANPRGPRRASDPHQFQNTGEAETALGNLFLEAVAQRSAAPGEPFFKPDVLVPGIGMIADSRNGTRMTVVTPRTPGELDQAGPGAGRHRRGDPLPGLPTLLDRNATGPRSCKPPELPSRPDVLPGRILLPSVPASPSRD